MEIERKFLIKDCPTDLNQYEKKRIVQGYISTRPVIRIRQSNDQFILTVKGKGLISREEYELTIDQEAFDRLSKKLEYPMLSKTRYLIPYKHFTIELDVFHDHLDGLILGEVEFTSDIEANNFIAPPWFGDDVSLTGQYQNSRLCQLNSLEEI